MSGPDVAGPVGPIAPEIHLIDRCPLGEDERRDHAIREYPFVANGSTQIERAGSVMTTSLTKQCCAECIARTSADATQASEIPMRRHGAMRKNPRQLRKNPQCSSPIHDR